MKALNVKLRQESGVLLKHAIFPLMKYMGDAGLLLRQLSAIAIEVSAIVSKRSLYLWTEELL